MCNVIQNIDGKNGWYPCKFRKIYSVSNLHPHRNQMTKHELNHIMTRKRASTLISIRAGPERGQVGR